MTTTRLEFPVNVLRCAALALGVMCVAQPAAATARAVATVSVHDLYRGATGRVVVIRVTNNSTMGETIGSVLLVAPGPSWAVSGCAFLGPMGWSSTPGAGSCRFQSAAGTSDDIPVGGAVSFQVNLNVLAGSL